MKYQRSLQAIEGVAKEMEEIFPRILKKKKKPFVQYLLLPFALRIANVTQRGGEGQLTFKYAKQVPSQRLFQAPAESRLHK